MTKREPVTCKHPSKSVSGCWVYHGTKLASANGHCEKCGTRMTFCQIANKLVPKDKVKKPLGELDGNK